MLKSNIVKSVAVLLTLVLLSSCGGGQSATQVDNMPQGQPAQPFAIYLQRVVSGQSAYEQVKARDSYARPQEGWQYVTFDLIVENLTSQPIWSPLSLDGNLIDTGGYKRDFHVVFNVSGFGGGNQTYLRQLLLPGIRYRNYAHVLIPLNQQPASVQVGFDFGPALYTLDANRPDDNLAVPFDSAPSYMPQAKNGMMEFMIPNDFRVKYWDFHFSDVSSDSDTLSLRCIMESENLGGENLNIDQGLGFVGVDNNGNYYDELEPKFIVGTPPGMVKEGECYLFLLWNKPQADWLWFALVDTNFNPVAQLQLPVNK